MKTAQSQFGEAGIDCWNMYDAMLLTLENNHEEEFVASMILNDTSLGLRRKDARILYISQI